MERNTKTVLLAEPSSERMTKRIAIAVFSRFRNCFQLLQAIPSHAKQTSLDVRDAWRETAHTKA